MHRINRMERAGIWFTEFSAAQIGVNVAQLQNSAKKSQFAAREIFTVKKIKDEWLCFPLDNRFSLRQFYISVSECLTHFQFYSWMTQDRNICFIEQTKALTLQFGLVVLCELSFSSTGPDTITMVLQYAEYIWAKKTMLASLPMCCNYVIFGLCLLPCILGADSPFSVSSFTPINKSLSIALVSSWRIQREMKMHIKKQLDMKNVWKIWKKKFWQLDTQWKESASSSMSKLSFEGLHVLMDWSFQISVNIILSLSSLLHNCSTLYTVFLHNTFCSLDTSTLFLQFETL